MNVRERKSQATEEKVCDEEHNDLYIFSKYYLANQIKEGGLDRLCGMDGRKEKYMWGVCG